MSKPASLAPSTSQTNFKLFKPEQKGPESSTVRPSVELLGSDKDFQNAVGKVLAKNPEFVAALDTFKSKLEKEFGSFEAALENGSAEQFKSIIESTKGLEKFEKALMREVTGEVKPSNEKTESPSRNDIRALSAPVQAA